MNKGYTIKDIFELMLSKLWLLLLLLVVGGAAAFSVSKFVMPLQYESYTSMYVKNNTALTDKEGVNLSDLNASKSLVSTYIAVLQDDAVMESVGDVLLQNYEEKQLSKAFTVKTEEERTFVTPASLRSCLTMAAVDETEVLKIKAITTDPELSAALCNTLAKIAPNFLIRVVGAGSVEAIGPAKANSNPVSPNIPKMTLIGALLGFLLAVGCVFLLDLFDNTIKDPEWLTEKYDRAIIGEIQSFQNGKEKKGKAKKVAADDRSQNLLTSKDIPFYITEAYKAMRTNLSFSLSTSDTKVFVVSSANPGEGKSTTAANLAISLAQLDNKVLLIDADMRKPVQHKIFKLKNQVGLSSYIGKMSKLEESIRKSVITNLDVMPSGPKPPNPSELMASEQMADILHNLSEKYEYIILDTPPINVVSDAMGVSNSVAGMLLVLRYGATTIDDTDNAMKKIDLSDMNMLGFVMNYIQNKRHAGSYYNYKYKSKYYDYGGYGYGNDKPAKVGH